MTGLYEELFSTDVALEVFNGGFLAGEIVQGSQLKPVLKVAAFDSVAHAGLDAEVTVRYPSAQKDVTLKLQWSQDGQNYIADTFFDTTMEIGTLSEMCAYRSV